MIIKRDSYLNQIRPFIDNENIKIITGIRRTGKSVLLEQIQELLKFEYHVNENQILSINFELFEFSEMAKNPSDLHNYIVERSSKDKKMYFFFDEIQLAKEWQRVINSLRVEYDSDIYITGSNASILSGELATLLSGRYIKFEVFPFSFKEFLEVKNTDINDRALVNKTFEQFFNIGSMPILDFNQGYSYQIKNLSDVYDSIILRDVSTRSGEATLTRIRAIAQMILESISSEISITRLRNRLTEIGYSMSTEKLRQYIQLFIDAYLFQKVELQQLRGIERLKSNNKYYVADVGLWQSQINPELKSTNLGNRLENIVFQELIRRGYMVKYGKIGDLEIDFVATRGNQKEYFQVAYRIPEKSQREVQNLSAIHDSFPKTLILGINEEKIVGEDGVMVKDVIDWLLE